MTELTEIYTEIQKGVKTIQDKSDVLESKGLTTDSELKALKENVSDLMVKSQDTESKNADLQKTVNSLEADLKRTSIVGSEKSDIVGEFKTALREYARKNVEIDHELITKYNTHLVDQFAIHESQDSKKELAKSLSVQSNPNGGYLVLPDRIQLTVKRDFETSPMRQVANIITTSTESVEMVIDDNASTSGGWVSETGTRNDTATAQLGLLEIKTHEQYAQPMMTQKLLDDASINIESWLSEKTQDILLRTENTGFVKGDGAGKPKGILGYDAWATAGSYERGKIEQVNSGVDAVIKADTLKKLVSSVKEVYQPNSKFLMQRASFEDVTTLKDLNNNYLLNTNSMKEGDSKILLGKSVIFADDMDSVALNALAIAYGDFRIGYTIVDRVGIRVLRDPFTAKPYIKFYTTKRVGGAVTNYESFKIYKLAA